MTWDSLYFVVCVVGVCCTPALLVGWVMDRWPDLFDRQARADARYCRKERVARIMEESRRATPHFTRDPSPKPRHRV